MLLSTTLAHAAEDAPQPKAIESEYRKFEDLLSTLRARNAQQFKIASERGIDEASFVAIGGIEQWITIRGWNRKIIIVGHSFGSIVGLQMARAKPDLFYAYVGTGQVADNFKNYLVAYEELLKKARATSNQQAIGELIRVGPPPYKSGEGYAVQRRWANAFEGADQFLFGTIGLTLVAPGNSVQDINDSADGQMLSAEHFVPETKSI